MSSMTQRRLLRALPLAAAAFLAIAPTASAEFGDRLLERGHRGHDVRVLQSWLTQLGFRTEVDGVFGEGTERSVDRYDRKNGLEADHAVSRGQARRMRRQVERKAPRRRSGSRGSQRGYSFGERTLRRGHRGHDVRVLQSWLTKLGFQTGVDGVFGRGTETRVERYEKWTGITQDGRVSRAQARRMRRQVEDGEDLPEGGRTETVSAEGHVFPVQGPHTYGDGLGAGRNHRGVDVMADCGIPLVAAQGGTVYYTGYQSGGAGHYIVITGAQTGRDYVYMHLAGAPAVRDGDTVETGQQIGQVGDSGNSTACHLHFELWSQPGWYKGGDFLDPMPELRAWDRATAAQR